MFIDERDLIVRAGHGGDGVVAFRREARIPRGGPAGGDGGRGGDVVLIADEQLTTFSDMQGMLHIRAAHGQPGRGKKQHGSKGADREIPVPLGTSIYDAVSGELLIDLAEPGQRYVAAKGGAGGKGNASFATALDQTPRHATLGERTEERRLRLHLRLLADVGLVGLPNAGKSTLLSRLSEARPRVADYPFTTLAPFLGIVELSGFRRFVMADLPGLIEGAHTGQGLGDRFLRHVERTRVLLHLVDPHPVDESDPVENWKTIRGELEAYGRGLADRPELIVLTKADLDPPEGPPNPALSRLSAVADRQVYPISAVTGQGLAALLEAVAEALATADAVPAVPDAIEPVDVAEGGAQEPPTEDVPDEG